MSQREAARIFGVSRATISKILQYAEPPGYRRSAPVRRPKLDGLPDAAEICGCNGVCKGTIVAAINEKGLTSLDEVRLHTKASASCGSCRPEIKRLVMEAVQEDAA